MATNLIQEIDELAEVPAASARAYKGRLAELVEKVNVRMSSRPDVKMLIGDNPMRMMFDNHKNHALFMSSVFSLNAGGLLASTVPWVYRAYHHHGFAWAYFPAHLQAWRQVLAESMDPDAAAPLLGIYEWLESRHETFIELAGQDPFSGPDPAPEWRETFEAFFRSLLEADRQACMELARRSVRSISKLPGFYLNVLQPAMYRVGAMWETGKISVAKEHLASALVNRIMSMQYIELMDAAEAKKGSAAVGTVANEFHELGATMVANALEADGWNVDFLGANTPAEEFLALISEKDYDIVALSATIPFNLETVQDVIQQIRSGAGACRPRILAGGLVFRDFPGLAEKLGADASAPDCGRAVEIAEKWRKNPET